MMNFAYVRPSTRPFEVCFKLAVREAGFVKSCVSDLNYVLRAHFSKLVLYLSILYRTIAEFVAHLIGA